MSAADPDDFGAALHLLAKTLAGEVDHLAATGLDGLVRIRPKDLAAQAPEPAPIPVVTAPIEIQQAPPPPLPTDAAGRLRVLCDDTIGDCQRCKLHRGRNRLVFGAGNPEADLVFVGEGPGADEDRQGIPFVGRAGELLTKMILAMGVHRDDVYICNVVKCRPPNNRDPEPDEVDACEPFLKQQLATLKPKVIVGLGRCATQTLLRTKRPISQLRGQWTEYEGIAFMPTFHPAFLLRSPDRKREAWADLQQVMKTLGMNARPGGQPVVDVNEVSRA